MTQSATTLPLRPTTSQELADQIRAAAESKTQIQLTGSHSLPLTHFNPEKPRQQISTLRLNKILDHAIPDMTISVQTGITLEALQSHLAFQNQWLPIDPPATAPRNPNQRTIGGLIATNSLGPLRFSQGDWRLLVLGMSFVDPTGTLIKGGGRTVKNVAGYSTPRLMIGSCGALGAIAEITLRTFARPADEQALIFFCDSHQRAEQLLAEILLAPVTPAYIEAAGARTFAKNPLQLPTIKRGIVLIVGFLDRPQSCAAQIETLRNLPAAQNLESISQPAAPAGRIRLWLTSEPALADPSTGAAFRIHTLSSNVCKIIADLEDADISSSPFVVAEAGAGGTAVIRTVLNSHPSGTLARSLPAIHDHTTIVQTQGPRTAPVPSKISSVLKSHLDPHSTFGLPPA